MNKLTMNRLTLLIISIIFFLTSNVVIAQNYKGYKDELPINLVTIPVLKGGFEVTLAALYLQPSSDNLLFTTKGQFLDELSSVTQSSESIEPDYGWGFLFGVGYVIPNTANDIQLNWMHFNDNDEASENYTFSDGAANILSVDNGVVLSLSNIGDYADAFGKVKYKFDTVDLDFGRYINITNHLDMRLFSGLRYTKIESDVSVSYSGSGTTVRLVPSIFVSNDFDSDSTFNGVGPLFGLSGNYNIGYGLGLSAAFDTALLVGSIDFDQSNSVSHTTGSGLQSNSNSSFDYDDTHIIAPAFDAKIGINYTYAMNNGTQFKFEIGYMAAQYIDVIETGEFDESDPVDTIDFSLNGAYLSLNVKI